MEKVSEFINYYQVTKLKLSETFLTEFTATSTDQKKESSVAVPDPQL